MKKTIIIIVIIILLLVVAGYFMLVKNKSAQIGPLGQTQSSGTAGVKEGLLGILQSTSGVKCSVNDPTTGTYAVISKGDKVRIEGMNFLNPTGQTATGEKGGMINDGTWAYIWSGTQGSKFNIKDMQAATQAQNPNEKAANWQDWAKSMQESGAKYNCNPAVATDADFTPPSNVTFQDFGELLKGLKNMQQNAPSIPSNIPTSPSGY